MFHLTDWIIATDWAHKTSFAPKIKLILTKGDVKHIFLLYVGWRALCLDSYAEQFPKNVITGNLQLLYIYYLLDWSIIKF